MKYLFFLILCFNVSFGQQNQDIEIKIISDSVRHFSSFELNPICYSIANKSNNYYYIPFDTTGFNTAEDEFVDSTYVGLADFRVFDEKIKLKTLQGSHAYDKNLINQNPTEEEILLFKKENNIESTDISDILIYYNLVKRSINLVPKETKSFCTNITLPIYNSQADGGSLFYDVKDNKSYYFQIHLNIPPKIVKKYFINPQKSLKKYKIFSGNIVSNKVYFVYVEKHYLLKSSLGIIKAQIMRKDIFS